MNRQKLALILITSAMLAGNSYASTTHEYTDAPAASSEQRETVSAASEDAEATADAQSASADPATPPVPTDPTAEPEKAPLCSGVANCTGQVIKGVVVGIAAAALAILYLGLVTGLIFVL